MSYYCRLDEWTNNPCTDISDKKFTTSSHRDNSKREFSFSLNIQ